MAPTMSKLPSDDFHIRRFKEAAKQQRFFPPAVTLADFPLKPEKGATHEYASIRFALNPDIDEGDWNSTNTTERKIPIYDQGDPKAYLLFRRDLDSVFKGRRIENDTQQKLNVTKTLLGPGSREIFTEFYEQMEADNAAAAAGEEILEEDMFEFALNKLAHEAFPNPLHAYRKQKRYMKKTVMDTRVCPSKYIDQISSMSKSLRYYPYDEVQGPWPPLTEAEQLDIIDDAKDYAWDAIMQKQEKEPWDLDTVTKARTYYKNLYESEEVQRQLNNIKMQDSPDTKPSSKKKRKSNDDGSKKGDRNNNKKSKKCEHCSRLGHKSSDCWELEENSDKRPKGYKPKGEEKQLHIAAIKTDFDVAGEIEQDRKRLRISDHVTISNTTSSPISTKEKTKKVTFQASKRKANVMEAPTEISDADYQIGCPMVALTAEATTEYTLENNSNCDIFDGYVDVPEYLLPFFDRASLNKKTKLAHYTGEIVVEILDRNGKLVPIRALLDTGTTSTLILRDFVKKGRAGGYKGQETTWKTKGGTFKTKKKALIDFKFPELNTDKKVTWICHVDETANRADALYDMIIGMDLMTAIGIYVDTDDKVIRWKDDFTPLGVMGALNEDDTLEAIYNLTQETPVLEAAEERQKRILDADYSAVDIDAHVDGLEELNPTQKELLKSILHKHKPLFQGGLGVLNIKPIHLELQEGAKPYHARPFGIPQAFEKTTKKEIDRLLGIGVLKKTYDSEWAAPSFIQPKKTGDVRVLTDFRRLNNSIKRKPFPLPKISDVLQRLAGFTYATAIDLSMGYYHIPMDEASQKLCSTILPWGKYQWTRMPMGVKCAPDIFQAIVTDLFSDLDYVRAYIDDILITSSSSFEEHMEKLDTVLTRLEQAGFRANVRKCFFAQTELDYLGYWLSRDGIQPQPKKVEAIMRLKPPKTARQVKQFLGMVNFYRDMWRRRSHLLSPLTALVGKKTNFKWGPEQQQAFDEIKATISKETLLAFPDFSKPFHIYTDASDYQLGSVIMQDDKPLAFYSRKMTSYQQGYTTGEQELLSIVETLKEFRNILLGQDLIVHTDHKNILYDGDLANDRITRWRHILEEYGPKYVHIAGKDNVVADALSRLDADPDMEALENNSLEALKSNNSDPRAQCCACIMALLNRDETIKVPDGRQSSEVVEFIMANNSDTISEKFPLSPSLIAKYQQKDKALIKQIKDSPDKFGQRTIEGAELTTTKPDNKILVPKMLQPRIVAWYHEYLTHPGDKVLEKTMRQTLHWDGMRKDVERYVRTCRKCQLCKKTNKRKHGILPHKEAEPSVPWERVNVDMIGPYTVKQPDGTTKTLRAMTMIDPATGWFEIQEVSNIDSDQAQQAFDDTWLCRYPRPKYIGHDGGSEFKKVFAEMIENFGLKRCKGTAYNPQSNAIVERVHQVLGDMLRTFELEEQQSQTTGNVQCF